MGTRSRVAVMHGDVCKSVYCHYNGYLACTGRILQEHWDSVKANLLLARGDNSGIKETIAEMRFYEGVGEEDAGYQIAHSFEEFLDQVDRCCGEYYYVLRDGVWYAGCLYETQGLIKGGLVPLAEALQTLAVAEDE